MQVVWFKRDLRLQDHAALTKAATLGKVLPLYILEPELWQQPDMSERHYLFLKESLSELENRLKSLGHQLTIKVGAATDILSELHNHSPIQAIHSHQETWNMWTYNRDKSVLKWVKKNSIPWYEPTQTGVIRKLKDRDGWAYNWFKTMNQPILKIPHFQSIAFESDTLPSPQELGLKPDDCINRQKGGRAEGVKLLKSFFEDRGEGYTTEMSSPVTAFESCSRLSTHLAFGTLSIREVYQTTESQKEQLKNLPREMKGKWPSAMRSFSGRLRWHCHFIQKLEDEPHIELENMHPAYNGLRESDFNEDFFKAWKEGKTGYPMIDACMRALTSTGWLNFRMRAMLMSFASYHLWLHWRPTSLHLAKLFTDYEPGIHYSQAQMQSGTTGINTIRIYNPIKQSVDQDPDGVFIRQWIPELRNMDKTYLHTPWECPSDMNGYPMPIVDEKLARKAASDQLYTLRKGSAAHKEKANQIVKKHGSRKKSHAKTTKQKPDNTKQIELPL